MRCFMVTVEVAGLAALAVLHFYRAFGGRQGMQNTIPRKFKFILSETYKTEFMLMTLFMAVSLLISSFVISLNYWEQNVWITPKWTIAGTCIIGIVFLLRAIGDFNYCGIFKAKTDDPFARKDNLLFIPSVWSEIHQNQNKFFWAYFYFFLAV